MLKERYEEVQMEAVLLSENDIITESPASQNENPDTETGQIEF